MLAQWSECLGPTRRINRQNLSLPNLFQQAAVPPSRSQCGFPWNLPQVMTTEHLSLVSCSLLPHPLLPECVHCSCVYPALSLLTSRPGQAWGFNRPTLDAQQISCSGGISSSFMAPCSLSNYQATLSLFTSHLLFSVMVRSPSLLGHERGLHPSVKHLMHLAQCISKQCRKKCLSPYCLFHTVRCCTGMVFKARSQVQHLGKQLISGQ